MKDEFRANTELTREHIKTAQGKHGKLDLINAVLPMIATIDGKDLFFFYDKDNPKRCFAVQCPKDTFRAWQSQLNDKPTPKIE